MPPRRLHTHAGRATSMRSPQSRHNEIALSSDCGGRRSDAPYHRERTKTHRHSALSLRLCASAFFLFLIPYSLFLIPYFPHAW